MNAIYSLRIATISDDEMIWAELVAYVLGVLLFAVSSQRSTKAPRLKYFDLCAATSANLAILSTALSVLLPSEGLFTLAATLLVFLLFVLVVLHTPFRSRLKSVGNSATLQVGSYRWGWMKLGFVVSSGLNVYALATTKEPIYPSWALALVLALLVGSVGFVFALRRIRGRSTVSRE